MAAMDALTAFEAKVVLLGAQAVGKTSLAARYVHNRFQPDVQTTVGAAFMTKRLNVDNLNVRLQIWDTAGQERFRAISRACFLQAPMYYRDAEVGLLVYDITVPSTFEALNSWVQELQRVQPGRTALCVVGNKADLADRRAVTEAEARAYAGTINAAYFEVSAKDDIGIDELFLEVGRTVVKRRSAKATVRRAGESSFSLASGPSLRDDDTADALPDTRKSDCC